MDKKDKAIYDKERLAKHGDKIRVRRKELYEKDKDHKRELMRRWYATNKDACNKRRRERYPVYKDKILADDKKWRASHKNHIRIYMKNWHRQFANDPDYKLKRNLRSRLTHILRGGLKEAKTFALLGCSLEHFKNYLLAQFQDGMTWSNYGINGWVIDHIRPCASFDLTDPEQQKRCFHFSNLQPLWAKDNLRKGRR